jgi:Thioredoxin
LFVKIDVDEVPDGMLPFFFLRFAYVPICADIHLVLSLSVAAKYNVSAMPTFVFIKAGEIIDRLMGANVERLQEMIEENK